MAGGNIPKHIKKVADVGKPPVGSVGDVRATFPNSTKKSAANDPTYKLDDLEKAEKAVVEGASTVVDAADFVSNKVGMGTFVAPIALDIGAAGIAGAAGLVGAAGVAGSVRNFKGNVGELSTVKTLGATLGENRFFKPIGGFSNWLASGSSKIVGGLGFKNAASMVAEAPSALAAKPMVTGLMEASFISASAIQMTTGGLTFAKGLATLKQMAFEITGKKYSAWEVLFGDAPEVVKNERGQMLKVLAVSEGAGAISLGLAIKNAARVVSPWLWGGITAVGAGASMLIGEGMLPVYDQASKAFNAGQPIPPEMYAKIIGVSKELTNHGGEAGPFAQAIATQYAAENVSPADVIREMESGALKQRIDKIIAENDAKAPAKTEEKTSVEQPKISHVAALEQPREKKPLAHLANKEREIVGDKTREIVNAALANNQMAGQAI